jgi:pyrimidine 5'-nucleotidase
MSITTLFFDLDNTLYPSDNGIWASIGNRMNIFIKDQLNLPDDKVISLRHSYYEKYGTTLRGLQIHHSIDADEFLDYVHDLPIEEMIQPDPELRVLLLNLPKRKFIFTNSNIEHAERVLQSLHIAECFDEAYHIALKLAAGDNPSNCIFLDDSVRNLTPAFEQGFYTILIGTTDSHPVAYHSLKRPHDLQHVMPDLWNQ